MRDILLAYGERTMRRFRFIFANTLRDSVPQIAPRLIGKGWQQCWVVDGLSDSVYSAINATKGEDANNVRMVTAVAKEICETYAPGIGMDRTSFWMHDFRDNAELYRHSSDGNDTPCRSIETPSSLSQDAIIALTKYFVLEWSHSLEYDLYLDWPSDLLMR